MTVDATPTKVVLLLGAGFSRFAGLPVMSEFGDPIWHRDRIARLIGPVDALSKGGQAAQSAPALLKAGRTFELFQQYCDSARTFLTTSSAISRC